MARASSRTAPELFIGDVNRLAQWFAVRTALSARTAIEARGRFALAIPGGSVAEHFLPALAVEELPWTDVDLFWCDERCVPAGDTLSNYQGARRLLLDGLGPAGPRVHRMAGDVADPPLAARSYARDLALVLGSPPVLDLLLLGVGEDGHVGSLFPGHRALLEMREWVVVERESPKPPPTRLTMTLPVIAAAREVAVVAFGRAKGSIMCEAMTNAASALPVAIALRVARAPQAYLDDEAGAELSAVTRAQGTAV